MRRGTRRTRGTTRTQLTILFQGAVLLPYSTVLTLETMKQRSTDHWVGRDRQRRQPALSRHDDYCHIGSSILFDPLCSLWLFSGPEQFSLRVYCRAVRERVFQGGTGRERPPPKNLGTGRERSPFPKSGTGTGTDFSVGTTPIFSFFFEFFFMIFTRSRPVFGYPFPKFGTGTGFPHSSGLLGLSGSLTSTATKTGHHVALKKKKNGKCIFSLISTSCLSVLKITQISIVWFLKIK